MFGEVSFFAFEIHDYLNNEVVILVTDTDIPFHSKYMEAIKEDMLQALSFLDTINMSPLIPVVSTVKAVVEGSFDKYQHVIIF